MCDTTHLTQKTLEKDKAVASEEQWAHKLDSTHWARIRGKGREKRLDNILPKELNM